MNGVERFANWFRHDLDDFDFLWNICMLARGTLMWLLVMISYYIIFVDKKKKEKNDG